MKKWSYLFGGVAIGIALTVSTSAFAEELQSMIGKTVDSQASVVVDGKELNVQAIIIEGTSYAPVRAVGESVGRDVAWTDGKVVLSTTKEEPGLTTSTPEASIAPTTTNQSIISQIIAIRGKIKALEDESTPLVQLIWNYEIQPPEEKKITEEEYNSAKAKYEENLQKIKELEDQIKAIYPK